MRYAFSFLIFLQLCFAQDSIRWNPWIYGARRSGEQRSLGVAPRRDPRVAHFAVEFAAAMTSGDVERLRLRGAEVTAVLSGRAAIVSAPSGMSLAGLNIAWSGALGAADKISPAVRRGPRLNPYFVIEFHADVDMGGARAIAIEAGMRVIENPDLLPHDLLVEGTLQDLTSLAAWDEVEYVFPASIDLIRGVPVHGCAGALTSQGQVATGVPTIGDGWDGPGQNAAALGYAFASVTEKLPAASAQSEIVRAFSEWAKYAKIAFTETSATAASDTLTVLFATGAHGDAYPFTDPTTLAHTFYPYPLNPEPIAGDLHFNDSVNWNIGGDTDLFSVALHETGHALGLGHSDNPADVMYPYYKRVSGLSQGDITAVLELYAAQDSSPAAAPLSIAVQAAAATVTASSVPLNGTVSGGSGLAQVTWRNGASSGAAQGAAAWSAIVPLAGGLNVITFTARDGANNIATATVSITLQSASSTVIQIAQPSAAGVYNTASNTVTLGGTASDAAGLDHVSWANQSGGAGQATLTTSAGATSWITSAVALLSGQNIITATAYGKAGGTASRSITVTYTPPVAPVAPVPTPPGAPAPTPSAPPTGPSAPPVSTTPPTLTILSPASTSVGTTAATIVFTGTASDSAGVTAVTWSNSTGAAGAATGTTNWRTGAIPLLVGTNQITIKASDAAGNTAWRSVTVTRTSQ